MDEEYDKILSMLCSVDESNRELGFAIAKSLGFEINLDDWRPFFSLVESFYRRETEENRKTERYQKALFQKIAYLKHFDLSDYGYDIIPRGAFFLRSLTSADIRHAKIRHIPDEIEAWYNLERLSLSPLSELESITTKIHSLPKLDYLLINASPKLVLPDDWGAFPALKKLEIMRCGLSTLPSGLVHAPMLQELNIGYNNFNTLPEILSKLPSVEVLSLSACPVDLRQALHLPPKLNTLKLSTCGLNYFPVFDFKKTPLLRSVDLSLNSIKKLPESIFHEENTLSSINLSHNIIDKIPDSISTMPYLAQLNLENNKLKTIPDSLAKIKGLRELYLRGNPLNPREIYKIKRLLPGCNIRSGYS